MANLNPTYTPTYRNWNYSNSNKEFYSETLVGTVQAIQLIQATNFQTREPRFWSDGNPVMNIRLALADANGDLVCFTFQKAGKAAREGKKRSVHMDLFHLTGDTDLANLIGKTIEIKTQPGNYGPNNPRPFEISLSNEGPFELKNPLPEEFKLPEIFVERPQQQVQQQPQYQAATPQPPMYGQFYAPPVAPQPMQPMQPQPQYQQPMQNQVTMNPMPAPAPAPAPQPQAAPMPQGMDPQIMAAMQAMGATNVQPVAGPYDDSIPF